MNPRNFRGKSTTSSRRDPSENHTARSGLPVVMERLSETAAILFCNTRIFISGQSFSVMKEGTPTGGPSGPCARLVLHCRFLPGIGCPQAFLLRAEKRDSGIAGWRGRGFALELSPHRAIPGSVLSKQASKPVSQSVSQSVGRSVNQPFLWHTVV